MTVMQLLLHHCHCCCLQCCRQAPSSSSTRRRSGSSSSSSQDSDSASLAAAASTARDSAFGAALSAALSDATWYPQGVTLGIVLEHFYAVETIAECRAGRAANPYYDEFSEYSSNMPDRIQPESLKGADLLLHWAARAFGLKVKILPVVSQYTGFEFYDPTASNEPLPPRHLAVMKSFRADPAALLKRSHLYYEYFGEEGFFFDEEEDEDEEDEGQDEQEGQKEGQKTEEEERPLSDTQKKLLEASAAKISGELVWVKPPGKQHLKYCGPVEEYEGNTSCSSCFYAAAALIVVVPPVGAPARQG